MSQTELPERPERGEPGLLQPGLLQPELLQPGRLGPERGGVSHHADHAVPWGMQVVVRYDKKNLPREVDVAEAAARSVVALLASPEAAPGGPWYDAVEHWRDGRIRKLVRRARGVRWRDVQELPGVTVTQDGPGRWGEAAARAIVPGPTRPLPPALAKLQVEGTHFPTGAGQDDGAPQDLPDGAEGGARPGPGARSVTSGAVVHVEVTPLHHLTSGKLAAQCAHAAQLAWVHEGLPPALRQAWVADGFRVEVGFPDRAAWESRWCPVTVVDAGFTELDGPTQTTRAWW